MIEPGIFSNPINADVDVRLNRHFGCCVLKGDNVGIGVMIEEVFIDLKEILIGAEDVIDSLHLNTFLLKEVDYERFQGCS